MNNNVYSNMAKIRKEQGILYLSELFFYCPIDLNPYFCPSLDFIPLSGKAPFICDHALIVYIVLYYMHTIVLFDWKT